MTGLRWQSALALIVAVLAGMIAFAWPLFLRPEGSASPLQAPMVFALVLPLSLAIVLAELAGGELDVKALAMLGVLAAVGSILRPLSAGTAGFELVFFLLILAGRVFGAGFGFALGAITLFTSALITSGVGPWLPYQMLAAGFIGLFAGWLPKASGRGELVLLAGYGMVSAFGYGWLMDFSFWPFALGDGTQLSFDPAATPLQNLHRFALFNLATSMGWNLGRALTNAVVILMVGAPLLRLLRRTARRASFTAGHGVRTDPLPTIEPAGTSPSAGPSAGSDPDPARAEVPPIRPAGNTGP
ncbi:MAG: ECF transporter S component [Micropruina sp.]|uniref:ECF transporter S component n=1 Tax=Micropruina sp. TaxID=2737536 RepID=UPI0039E66FCF